MPNPNAPFGLRPVKHLDGSPWNGKVNMYFVPASNTTAIFVGDPVRSAGSAGTAGTVVNGIDVEGMPTITVAGAGDTLRGVVVGFLPNPANPEQLHRPASQARIALVCDQPDVVFEIQENGTGSSALVANDIGENANIAYAAGSTITGRSAVTLNSSTHGTETTKQLRILGLSKRPGMELGTGYGVFEVMINLHELKSTAGV